jgi:hypothetical protein
MAHRGSAAGQRSAAFVKQSDDISASFATIEFNFFHGD